MPKGLIFSFGLLTSAEPRNMIVVQVEILDKKLE